MSAVKQPARILVVDDQESSRTFVHRLLSEVGYETRAADSVLSALPHVESGWADLVVQDVRMPDVDGIEGLRRMKAIAPSLPVILLTAYATVETAVHAMKLGAYDYLRKPIEPEELEIVVARALEHRRLVEENRELRAEVEKRFRLENMIGRSPAMTPVFERIRRVASVDLPVLITGESGTGKDLVARAIHGLSRRSSRTFLSLNCAAIPETLLESELFGHERGAFSGAERARPGYFREADGGTLFLDEIGEMSQSQQSRLLRVLESGEFIPLGSEQPVHVDVRILVATHRDLEQRVREGRFREDLLFRIDTVRVHIPALRERREDIPLLVAHFLERAEVRPGSVAPRMSAAAMRVLLQYEWPGNVRELEHAIEHAVLVAEGDEIRPEDLPNRIHGVGGGRTAGEAAVPTGSYRDARREFEKAYFSELMRRAGGNVSRAAQIAVLHRATLHDKLKKLGLASGEAEPGEPDED